MAKVVVGWVETGLGVGWGLVAQGLAAAKALVEHQEQGVHCL